jgi:hypothetical protein
MGLFMAYNSIPKKMAARMASKYLKLSSKNWFAKSSKCVHEGLPSISGLN